MRRSLILLPLAFAACGTVSSPASTIPSSSQPIATEGAPRSAAIAITETGFEPREVTVSATNGTVLFVNQAADVRQPMSDPHPEHSLFPAIGCPELTQGSTCSVGITQSGDWTFHDEKKPGSTGVIHAK